MTALGHWLRANVMAILALIAIVVSFLATADKSGDLKETQDAMEATQDTLQGTQKTACARGNVSRLGDYLDYLGDERDAEYQASQANDPEVEEGFARTASRKGRQANDLLKSVEETGFQTAPGQPTIDCEEATK